MAKRKRKKTIDFTARMTRNASDRDAVEAGCRFDVEAAMYAVHWIERNCRLYEGTNEPLVLMSVADQDKDTWAFHELEWNWDDPEFRQVCHDRLNWHCDHVDNPDSHVDWQFDCIVRIFGWQIYSDFHNRWIRRFTEVSVWISKKNKKSPTMAAVAMYLSLGDGEMGAKTFLLSKNGSQVRKNGCRHIHEMWKRSPLIKSEAKFNVTQMALYHEVTSSWIEPLSSDTKQRREANEGLNGNTMVDETHVVDRETVAIVDRAGISRSEPIHAEFSTAGKNISGYGGQRFKQCLAIHEEREISIHWFVYIAAAPQETKAEDLQDRDHLVALIKLANPALDHTINMAEVLNDYGKSKNTPLKLREFMMYRLNIWVPDGIPYIAPADWARGKDEELSIEHFRGEEAHCAFDIAQTTDLFSWCWAFERDGAAYMFWNHWLPRATAIEFQESVDYMGFEADGFIRLLPGRLISEDAVFDEVEATIEENELHVMSVNFDPARAKYFQKLLTDAGHNLVLFRQSNREYDSYVDRFRTLVIGEENDDGTHAAPKLYHRGNRLMAWQIEHCQIDEDSFGYKRPVKPSRGDYRKVDGVQTGVMAIRGLTEELGGEETFESAYANPDAPWHGR